MKIDKYELDSDQMKIVWCQDRYIMVVAGAGSGKTLTILGKINYLVNNLGYSPDDILCISFTKASSMELANKIKSLLKVNIDVFTFHKLGINILKSKGINKEICDSELLDNIIYNYLYVDIINYPQQKKYVLKLLDKRLFRTKNYLKYIENNTRVLEKNIASFIRLFKCNGNSIDRLYELLNKRNKRKYKYFLLIVLNIYLLYINYLKDNNECDFDDLIIDSKNIIDNKYGKYKYVIIDEYQDTSYIRFELIKRIVDNNNAKLMVVGDDFQSIYRFTGCNIDLFTNFSKYFSNPSIMYISNTYRNSQELVKIAGDFVMKNKYQIKKELKSNKQLDKPVKIVYYKNIVITIKKIIDMIDSSILIIGRNNNDINMIIDNNTFKYKDGKVIYKNKDITYLTAHKSKGLEYDNVIIINLVDRTLGFPSKLKDDITLKDLVSEEKYPFSEERRLFYVALTRTKNNVYLLSPFINKSIFVKELENNKNIEKIRNMS